MSKSKVIHYAIPTSLDQDERINHYLDQLNLMGMRPYYKKYANNNIEKHDSPKNYLEALLKKQLIASREKQIKSRLLKAGFGKEKTLESFNFKANINVNEGQISDLATCTFIKEKRNILFLGKSRVGKTHLAKGIARNAIEFYYSVRFIELDRIIDELLFKRKDVDSQKRFFDSLLQPDLLVIDEIKYRKSTPDIQEFLYRLIRQRFEQKSTIFTSNKDFLEWEKMLGTYAPETINRILANEYSIVILIEGEPYQVGNKNLSFNKSSFQNGQPTNLAQPIL